MKRTPDEGRRLRRWLGALLAELLLGVLLAVAARSSAARGAEVTGGELVRALELSGLALGSGAAYTRHPAQADHFAAWGEHPASLEHLPAGSLMPAPRDFASARREPQGPAHEASP